MTRDSGGNLARVTPLISSKIVSVQQYSKSIFIN